MPLACLCVYVYVCESERKVRPSKGGALEERERRCGPLRRPRRRLRSPGGGRNSGALKPSQCLSRFPSSRSLCLPPSCGSQVNEWTSPSQRKWTWQEEAADHDGGGAVAASAALVSGKHTCRCITNTKRLFLCIRLV